MYLCIYKILCTCNHNQTGHHDALSICSYFKCYCLCRNTHYIECNITCHRYSIVNLLCMFYHRKLRPVWLVGRLVTDCNPVV